MCLRGSFWLHCTAQWQVGFYDVGRRDAGTVTEHFACRIPVDVTTCTTRKQTNLPSQYHPQGCLRLKDCLHLQVLSSLDATPCSVEVLRTELAQITRSGAHNTGIELASGERMIV